MSFETDADGALVEDYHLGQHKFVGHVFQKHNEANPSHEHRSPHSHIPDIPTLESQERSTLRPLSKYSKSDV